MENKPAFDIRIKTQFSAMGLYDKEQQAQQELRLRTLVLDVYALTGQLPGLGDTFRLPQTTDVRAIDVILRERTWLNWPTPVDTPQVITVTLNFR